MRRYVVAVALANVADAVTFGLVTTPANLGGELNPLARLLFTTVGTLGVWAVKAIVVALVVAAVCLVGRYRPRIATGLLSLFVAISVAAATSNVVYS